MRREPMSTTLDCHSSLSITFLPCSCRNASKKEITKAYRKLAAEWHPDRFAEGEEKEHAEKKFIDIAAAKEVLTDPEKRQKFDNGEDPLDPEEQAQGGGPFWHQGFNPFGGGGFQFKFHF